MPLQKIKLYQPGLFAMVGMPFLILVFLNFSSARKLKTIELNYPPYKFSDLQHTPIINYSDPKGNFYFFSLDQGFIENALTKIRVNQILQRMYDYPDSDSLHNGIHIKLSEQCNYSDFVYFINLMLIHGIYNYYYFEDDFFCYFKEQNEKVYPSVKDDTIKLISLYDVPVFKCGYQAKIQRENFAEILKRHLQLHVKYWYFWALYLTLLGLNFKKIHQKS